MSEMSTILKVLKCAEFVVFIISPFNSSLWPLQILDGSWWTVVVYCKLNQGVSPVSCCVKCGIFARAD